MPFLKPQKVPRSRILEESTKKNGIRKTVFSASGKTEYIGEWRQNLQSGKGIEKRNHYIYEGDWQNGLKHGYGILSHENEIGVRTLIYDGHWKYNKKEGEGTQHFSKNKIYQGSFKNDLRNGFGKMWFNDGGFYFGYWTNGKREGHGLYLYANGDIYEGQWRNGVKSGEGIHYFMKTGNILTGLWIDNVPVVGQMENGPQRQQAIFPTPYPMRRNELLDMEGVYMEAIQSARKLLYGDEESKFQ